MATLVFSAVGSAVGSQIGGSVLGLSAAAAGRAAGAVAGALIDQRLLGPGATVVDGPRISRFRGLGGGEGQPLPRVWGRMRVSGQVIWATRFKETVSTRSAGGGGGGKGGGGGGSTTVREYSYSVSFAVALCEGPIDHIGRIWADGREVSPTDLPHRLHHGTETQSPDTLILAVEGADRAPAYPGVAYLVFEDLPLEDFGDRPPQISVEVFRTPQVQADPAPKLSVGQL
ncbi:MAG: host specificity protein, partial [Pseudomonadota bacterium]